jgi:RNA polymerase sigma factor (sigma-70 family)
MSATLTPLRPDAAPRRSRWSETDADVELLQAVRLGDGAAVAELYQRHHHDLRRFTAARFHAANPDDVVSEAFARTLRAMRNGAGPRDHARRYLFVAARTVAIAISTRDRRRREAERRYTMEAAPISAPVEEALGGAVHHAFGNLTERQRLVLWMTEVEGRTALEASTTLGIGVDAVHSLAYRSRQALRSALASSIEPCPVP